MAKWTYFIHSSSQAAVKIGKSDDPKKRLSGMQTSNPGVLQLIGALEGDCEAAWHRRFADLLIRGEWYQATPDLMSAIHERLAAEEQRLIAKQRGPDRVQALNRLTTRRIKSKLRMVTSFPGYETWEFPVHFLRTYHKDKFIELCECAGHPAPTMDVRGCQHIRGDEAVSWLLDVLTAREELEDQRKKNAHRAANSVGVDGRGALSSAGQERSAAFGGNPKSPTGASQDGNSSSTPRTGA